ncbi:MAG: putative Ig domain-containing protein [Opitutaceae bacterium]|nr:putative Ig domain-containing protein [Opitutaceae bacterium]
MTLLLFRLHSLRLHTSIAMLILLLQRSPAVQWLLAAEGPTPSIISNLLRSALVVTTAATAAHTLTGATTFATAPDSPAALTVGQDFSMTFAMTGAPTPAKSYSILGTLPPGLSIPGLTGGILNATTGTVSGTPSTAGNYRITIQGWDRVNAKGHTDDAQYPVDFVVAAAPAIAPAITAQPQPLGGIAGQPGSTAVVATGASTYQWYKGGAVVSGATGATLPFASLNSAEAGLYDVVVTGPGGATLSRPVVVGMVPAAGARTTGAVTTRAEWQDIHHPNGSTYDQFLLSGAAGTFTADPGQIARCSYLDSNASIVQVEMSGAGAITVVLANPSGPMAPALYNQSGIQYMQGKATIILAGADATTHFTIYSVGTATNPGVNRADAAYNGWADVAAAGILSTTGGLGGIHQGNVAYNAALGITGLYAPTVTSVGGLVVVHGITASGPAQPYLYFGNGGTVNVKIAGSSLTQPNTDSLTVGGLAQVQMGAGQDSCGRAAPASAIGTRLLDDTGADRTAALVTGP